MIPTIDKSRELSTNADSEFMLNFLFWNLNKRPIHELIGSLVHEYETDIVLLAECDLYEPTILMELRERTGSEFSVAFSPSDRVVIYTRFPSDWMTPINDADGLSIRRLSHPIDGELLIVAAHLPSRLYQSTQDQTLISTRLRIHIENAEEIVGHTRTLIVGDLNMNPYDDGVVGSEGLHGIMDRNIVGRQHRTVAGETRSYFYNPMWSRFGDEFPGSPGTYYYNSSSPVNHYWHVFDQVLLRPELLPYFRNDEMKIVTTVGPLSLLTEGGIPDTGRVSDHLPLVFRLNI